MTTRYLNIEAKHRRDGTFVADLEDFSVSDGEVLNGENILSNPDVSLYCLSHWPNEISEVQWTA